MTEPQGWDPEDNRLDTPSLHHHDDLDGDDRPEDDDPLWWAEEDDGVSDWWLMSHDPPRPGPRPLPCPHPDCGGQLVARPDIPGVSELLCLLCRRTIGEALDSDLVRWVGQDGMARAARMDEAPLWIRDDDVPE